MMKNSSFKVFTIISLILLISCNVHADDQKCHALEIADGCSIPFGLEYPYKNFFRPACDLHDVCYKCGKSYGWNRKHCDADFIDRLTTMCETESLNETGLPDLSFPRLTVSDMLKKIDYWQNQDAFSKVAITPRVIASIKIAILMWDWKNIKDPLERCKRGVLIYKIAVNAFSEFHYDNNPPGFCNKDCVWDLINSS